MTATSHEHAIRCSAYLNPGVEEGRGRWYILDDTEYQSLKWKIHSTIQQPKATHHFWEFGLLPCGDRRRINVVMQQLTCAVGAIGRRHFIANIAAGLEKFPARWRAQVSNLRQNRPEHSVNLPVDPLAAAAANGSGSESCLERCANLNYSSGNAEPSILLQAAQCATNLDRQLR